jgi:hypothetical protein
MNIRLSPATRRLGPFGTKRVRMAPPTCGVDDLAKMAATMTDDRGRIDIELVHRACSLMASIVIGSRSCSIVGGGGEGLNFPSRMT